MPAKSSGNLIDSLVNSGTSLRARAFLMLMAGLLGGFLAWMAVGRTGWLSYLVATPGMPVVAAGKLAVRRIDVGMTIGGLIGLLLGVMDAFAFDRFRDRARSTACLLLAGLVFGAIALQFGVPATVPGMGLDDPGSTASPGGAAGAQAAIAHGVVWAILGLGIGLVPGLLRRAPMLMRQGAFGGVLGGLVSGFVAAMLPPITATRYPGISTLPSFMAGGGLIGLFCCAAPYLFRAGSVRVLKGRNIGKEYLIAAPITLLGSGPAADILLTDDESIASSHCSIEESTDHMIVRPVAPEGAVFAATLVNGRPLVAPTMLRSGDEIRIGEWKLQFLTRDPAHSQNTEPETITAVPAKINADREQVQSKPANVPKNVAAGMTAQTAVEATQPIDMVTSPHANTTTDKTARIRARDLAELHKLDEGPKLVCLDGPNKGHVYMLPPGRPISIGRGTDRDIALVDDHAASRDHATVIAANGRYVLRDEGSANGTLLNNLPLNAHDPHRLEPRDIILIGRTVLRYEE